MQTSYRCWLDETTHVDALRETIIGELCEMGTIRSDQVAEAFRAVPRHLFAPGAPPAAVYAATSSVVTKRDDHGVPISSVSAPELQAFMLEQGAIRPGMTVLEIGSGGYNAALLAELVSSEGSEIIKGRRVINYRVLVRIAELARMACHAAATRA